MILGSDPSTSTLKNSTDALLSISDLHVHEIKLKSIASEVVNKMMNENVIKPKISYLWRMKTQIQRSRSCAYPFKSQCYSACIPTELGNCIDTRRCGGVG